MLTRATHFLAIFQLSSVSVFIFWFLFCFFFLCFWLELQLFGITQMNFADMNQQAADELEIQSFKQMNYKALK